jgi:hypothetical protein
VAGRKRVPNPAAGIIAFRMGFGDTLFLIRFILGKGAIEVKTVLVNEDGANGIFNRASFAG